MTNSNHVPDDIRRFIVANVPSVSFLEAMLLLHGDPQRLWDSDELSRRLYIETRAAAEILNALNCLDIVMAIPGSSTFRYQPGTERLENIIDQLAESYTKHLVEISRLIHSKGRNAQQFADALFWGGKR